MQKLDHAFKRRTIRTHLRKACLDFLEPVKEHDQALFDDCYKNIMVCGGAIASMYLGERPNDYDFYFKDHHTLKRLIEFWVEILNYHYEIEPDEFELQQDTCLNIKGEREFNRLKFKIPNGFIDFTGRVVKEGLRSFGEEVSTVPRSGRPFGVGEIPRILTNNAMTFGSRYNYSTKLQYQLIFRFHGPMVDIWKNFDFRHAMSGYALANDTLHIDVTTLETIISKTLIYQGSLYPIATLFRLRKFLKRGWRISAGQLIKIAHQLSEDVNFNDIEMLQEQLMGVDILFMRELLDVVEKYKEKAIDQTYLAEIIDKIFDGQTYEAPYRHIE